MRKYYRKYVQLNCSVCGKEIRVRSDYAATHMGMCQKCNVKKMWEANSYREHMSKAHKGMKATWVSLPFGESNFNSLYGSYRKQASVRGYEFNISKEEFRILTKQNCHYCGIEPKHIHTNGGSESYGYWVCNGLDRVNNELGYIISNVVPCCKNCNYAKQRLELDDFLDWVKRIYNYNFSSIDGLGSRQEFIK